MRLSKTAAHAALALAYLANHREGLPVRAREVAEHLGLPTDSALKILQTLARRGLLESQLGRAGGYRFHQPPDAITLLDVVEAIDGPLAADLPDIRVKDGLSTSVQHLARACDHAANRLRHELNRVTIAQLLPQTAEV